MTTTNPPPEPPRLGVPDWVSNQAAHTSTYQQMWAILGEQPEWGYAIPWVFRALAAPPGSEPLPAPPRPGDVHPAGAAYWCALVHVLVYSLGWSRPSRGLRWWLKAGMPTGDDARLRLLATYEHDGMLDLFTAWATSNFTTAGPGPHIDTPGSSETSTRPIALPVDRERYAEQLQGVSPYGGGTDPLHLKAHFGGPSDNPPSPPLLLHSSISERSAVLLMDSMQGWYQALTDAGSSLPPIGTRSWRVQVVVRPFGHFGTFRQSRVTGRWFAGRHRAHTPGN